MVSVLSSYYEKFLATGEVKCIDEEIPFEIPQGWEWCRLEKFQLMLKQKEKSMPQKPILSYGDWIWKILKKEVDY